MPRTRVRLRRQAAMTRFFSIESPPPALRKKGGSFELVQYKHSPALAVMDGMTFRQHESRLEPGDTIFVYTDGVTEAQNASNELFGTDRLLEALNSEADADVEALISNTTRCINNFVKDAPQFDDMTMLAFTYKGSEEQALNRRI